MPVSRAALLLPALAFLVALVVQVLLKAAGLESDHPLRVIGTPLIGAAVVFWGMRPYPRGGRLRLALMVGLGLFLVAWVT